MFPTPSLCVIPCLQLRLIKEHNLPEKTEELVVHLLISAPGVCPQDKLESRLISLKDINQLLGSSVI